MSISLGIENVLNKILPMVQIQINKFDKMMSRAILISMITLVIFFALLAFIIGLLVRKILISQQSINKYTISIGIGIALFIWIIVYAIYSKLINYIRHNYQQKIKEYVESTRIHFIDISKMLNIKLSIFKQLLSRNKDYIEKMIKDLNINDISATDFINII